MLILLPEKVSGIIQKIQDLLYFGDVLLSKRIEFKIVGEKVVGKMGDPTMSPQKITLTKNNPAIPVVRIRNP